MQLQTERAQIKSYVENGPKSLKQSFAYEKNLQILKGLDPETVSTSELKAALGFFVPIEKQTCDECSQCTWDLVEIKDTHICKGCLEKALLLFHPAF